MIDVFLELIITQYSIYIYTTKNLVFNVFFFSQPFAKNAVNCKVSLPFGKMTPSTKR
jgi:L-rhamnose mutarotase